MTPAGSWAGQATRADPPRLVPRLSAGTVRHLGGTVESLATGVNEARPAIGCYKDSWLTDHPLAWDAAAGVTDLNDGISEDAGRCSRYGA